MFDDYDWNSSRSNEQTEKFEEFKSLAKFDFSLITTNYYF